MRRGREPERTCVGCRGKDRKRALIRLVRDPDGAVRVDPPGSVAGRGAYVHPSAACVGAALRRRSLARALRTGLGREELGRLKNMLEGALERV